MRFYQHILNNLKTGETKILTVSPADWADLEVRTFRSEMYNGVFTSDAISQRFPNVGGEVFDKGGYWFILNAYLSDGVYSEIKYTRQIIDPYLNTYVDDFIGMLDFNPDSGWNYTEEFFEIKTIDSSKSNKFINRDEIKYDLFGLNSTDGVNVPDFNTPYREALYKEVDLFLRLASSGGLTTETYSYRAGEDTPPILGFNYTDVSINEIGDRISMEDPSESSVIYSNSLKQESKFVNVEIESFKLSTNISGVVVSGATTWRIDVTLTFKVYDKSDNIIQTSSKILDTYNLTGTKTQNIDKTYNNILFSDITIPEEGYVRFGFVPEVTPTAGGVIQVSGIVNPTTNTITYLNFYEFTAGWEDNAIRGHMYHEAMFRAIQLATSETDTSKIMNAPILGSPDSEFEDYIVVGDLARNHITNGFQLRQLTGRALNVSIRSLFKSASAITPIGCYYNKLEDKFYIDTIDKFYERLISPVSLGRTEDPIKIYPYKDVYFNQIESGYPNLDFEQFKGANEFNVNTAHETFVNIKKKKDLSSNIHASTVGIELARRRNASIAFSEDTKYDNLIFVTKLNSSFSTIQGGSNVDGFKGIDQYYNIDKTPRSNLQRQLKIYEAMFNRTPYGKFKFTSSVKDNNITYTDSLTGNTVNETDDIIKVFLGQTLIDPEIYEFSGLYTYEIRKAVDEYPHRIWEFLDRNNNRLYGYISEIIGNPFKQKATYKLIKANI